MAVYISPFDVPDIKLSLLHTPLSADEIARMEELERTVQRAAESIESIESAESLAARRELWILQQRKKYGPWQLPSYLVTSSLSNS